MTTRRHLEIQKKPTQRMTENHWFWTLTPSNFPKKNQLSRNVYPFQSLTLLDYNISCASPHDCVIAWKRFPYYWPFGRESTGHQWIPRKMGQLRGLWYFVRCQPKQIFEKHSFRRWFETPWPSLGHHCNGFPWEHETSSKIDRVSHFIMSHVTSPASTTILTELIFNEINQ